MTQPKFAPIMEQHEVREFQRIGVPAPWTPHRRARAAQRPTPHARRGWATPAPTRGYALDLAARFRDALMLEA